MIYKQVRRLCAEGDALAAVGKYPQSLDSYWEAFDLLPEPATRWNAATWILAAIGDANFLGEDYQAGVDNCSVALSCPGGLGNPLLHLRLGECHSEMGNLDRSADELARAYMGGGISIFANEDAKYFAFLKTRLQEPEGGW